MNEEERQQNYRQHRLRVKQATSQVNSQAPRPKPTDAKSRNNNFIELMRYLTEPNKGSMNNKTFTKALTYYDNQIGDNNKYPLQETKTKNYSIPFHVWQRYDHLNITKNSKLLEKLLRPNIFLDLQTSKEKPLGRLVIQLFTEACPEVVLQFVRTCLSKQHNRFIITRLLFPLWLEAELLLFDDKNALTSNNIEHDPMVINHGTSSGILSFPSRYLHGSKLRFITFTVSFTPIDVLNGKRIAFGIIRCGQNVLESLQSFEVTRSGKPCRNIAVSACGVV
ncbi:probable inactive peptidyl-prolyl cis-trans isomerase-like 6 [Lucilia cuprina]|uniref:probable inactive peptidyl-prolyl cis-trans isomerase-like 6 n=1 Tax=Lucilia cuprina TaxID=7375 RepID=UPI001F06B278|nr:probable inactive peptidyl-prolyl cis-trans isomerase-like 6 [Lucilia cuprina]